MSGIVPDVRNQEVNKMTKLTALMEFRFQWERLTIKKILLSKICSLVDSGKCQGGKKIKRGKADTIYDCRGSREV